MPHGTPDWGLVGPKETAYGLDDVGEGAVRLGSPHLFDRRGDVVFLDDFESGIGRWEPTAPVGGSRLGLSCERARSGALSMLMVAGNADPWDITATRHLAACRLTSAGIEVSFTIGEHTQWLEIMLEYWDGAFYHHGLLAYHDATGTLYYLDNANVQQALTPLLPCFVTDWRFHTMKIAMDWRQHRYIYAIFDDYEWDMGALGYYYVANALPRDYKAMIIHHGTDLVNAECYVDDVIVTQNE